MLFLIGEESIEEEGKEKIYIKERRLEEREFIILHHAVLD